jgi:hypothetical protein
MYMFLLTLSATTEGPTVIVVVVVDKLKKVLRFWMDIGYSFGNLDMLDRPPPLS